MPDYVKYLKYKKMYLKNININIPDENIPNELLNGGTIKTLSNNGTADGLTSQCFWISIRDYLHAHGQENKNITIRELKEYGGLEETTNNELFNGHCINDNDTIYIKNEYNDAANKIAELFNLTINTYTVNQNNIIIEKCSKYGDGQNIVNIAYFGSHFELITAYYPTTLLN